MYLNSQIGTLRLVNSASVLKNIVHVIIKYLCRYMKKKVGVDKLAKFQMTVAYIVQTRSILDNLEALQCKQCQRWQYHMQDW